MTTAAPPQPQPTTPTAPRRAWGRRLLVQGLAVLALLAALDLLVVWRMEPLLLADKQAKASTGLGRVALYHAANPPPDVLLIGSSRVQCDLDPSLLMNRAKAVYKQPVSVLNLGLAGGTPQAYYWLLKNVVEAARPPRLIIYGASEYEFNPNGRIPPWNYADELATLSDYPEAFPDRAAHLDEQLGFLFGRAWHLFRWRDRIHDTFQDMLAPSNPDASPIIGVEDSLGFLPLNHEMRPVDVRKLKDTYVGPGGHLWHYTVHGYLADRFEDLLRLAQARGTRVVLINMPITTIHESWLTPAEYAAYRTYLRDTAARYQVPFVDYNDHRLWQEPADFADTNHMNRVGAKQLSQRVSQDVFLPALQQLGWK